MKVSIMQLLFLTSVVAYAGEWIAVDGGTSTINVNEQKVEYSLWEFLATKKTYKFLSKESTHINIKLISRMEKKKCISTLFVKSENR